MASATPSEVVDPPPDVPANLNATDGSYADKVVVTWDDVTGEDYFELYRCATTSTGTCSKIANPVSNTTKYDDTDAAADGTVQYYQIGRAHV